MKKIMNPRHLAVLTLNQLEEGEDFLREVLDFRLRENPLNNRLDQALYTELVYGTTRMCRNLDYVLSQFSSRPLSKIKGPIVNNLRIALYQILYLDRIPPSAAVNEGVKLARQLGHEGVASFTNALLRSVLRSGPHITYPSFSEDPTSHLSFKYSFPHWIVKEWVGFWGAEETLALCQALNEAPKMHLRVNTLKIEPHELMEYFSQKQVESKPGCFVPEVLEVRPAHLVLNDPYLSEGKYYIQDESSALVGYALQVEPGQRVYDLCSAPGGKATHLAQLMEDQGQITCFDVNPNRLKLVDENVERLGISCITTEVGDATQELSLPQVERVLVDAPCSGLGTMRHRPDIRWRKNLEEVLELAAIQRKILHRSADYVAPGGLLVYSTCTLTKQENDQVAKEFLENHPQFSGHALPAWFPQVEGEPEWYRTIFPHHHGLDGFFVAVFRKNKL